VKLAIVALMGLIASFGGLVAHAGPPEVSHVGVVGGIKSANAPTGAVIDGLALSLSNRQFNLRNRGNYTWLALELRNVGSQTRRIFGFTSLSNVRAIVTGSDGQRIRPYRYPKVDFDAPVSTSGAPLPPRMSIWLAIPIDAMVPLVKPGIYTVRIETVGTLDAQTKQRLNLVSNALTIQM